MRERLQDILADLQTMETTGMLYVADPKCDPARPQIGFCRLFCLALIAIINFLLISQLPDALKPIERASDPLPPVRRSSDEAIG